MKRAFASEHARHHAPEQRRQKAELPRGESKRGGIAFQCQVGDPERRARHGVAQRDVVGIGIGECGALAAHLDRGLLGGDLHRERKSYGSVGNVDRPFGVFKAVVLDSYRVLTRRDIGERKMTLCIGERILGLAGLGVFQDDRGVGNRGAAGVLHYPFNGRGGEQRRDQ